MKNSGRIKPAMIDGKIDCDIACQILQLSVNDENKTSRQIQKKANVKKKNEIIDTEKKDDEDYDTENGMDLLEQIIKAVKNKKHNMRFEELSSLENKSKILKTYYSSQKEKLNYEKSLGNLFDRESIERILTFTINNVRNTLLNLPNNYAVNLEGLNKKEIKEFVTDDVNKLLGSLQNIDLEINN